VACVVVALLIGVAAPRPADARAGGGLGALRTIFDQRVDAIPRRALLTVPPQDLVDRARQRAARTVTDWRQGVFFLWAGAQIWAFAWLWRSGRAARVRDWLRRRIANRAGYRAAFGAVLGLLAPVAGLPFAFVSYRIGFNVGLTEQIIGSWLLDYARGMLVDAAGAAVTVAVVLELVDRTRLWYIAFLAILVAVSVEAVAVDAVVFVPLSSRVTLLRIAAAAPVEMVNASARTRTLTASTAGIGAFTRIVLGDVLIAAATPAEVAYVVAHEDAHVAHNDDLKMALIATAMFVFAVALAVLISDRIGFRRDDDAVSRLALVAAFLGGVLLVFFPLFNAYARGIEYRADEDARQRLRDPASAVRFLVRRADHDLVPLCYRRSSSWYFADYPAIGSRIAALRRSADPCPHSPAQ
jgi:Zn-dependent protease with chaperone function